MVKETDTHYRTIELAAQQLIDKVDVGACININGSVIYVIPQRIFVRESADAWGYRNFKLLVVKLPQTDPNILESYVYFTAIGVPGAVTTTSKQVGVTGYTLYIGGTNIGSPIHQAGPCNLNFSGSGFMPVGDDARIDSAEMAYPYIEAALQQSLYENSEVQ